LPKECAKEITAPVKYIIITIIYLPLVADSHSIMTSWRNYFSQLLNVHGAKDVRQAEIHTSGSGRELWGLDGVGSG